MRDKLRDDVEWKASAQRLAEELAESGHVRSDAWKLAIQETPRHIFVDQARAQHKEADGPWIEIVYSDSTLVTQRRPRIDGSGQVPTDLLPTSSSTMPSLMVDMLEALDIKLGNRILEIGTGTGYNAALLSHRLGAENVVSVDIDPDLVAAAKSLLAEIAYFPTLLSGNGVDGAPEHGPFDRIIATCAVDRVPLPWIEQLAPDGIMLVNLRGNHSGVLCRLHKDGDDDEVIGPVLTLGGNFMWMRTKLDSPLRTAGHPIVIGARNIARRNTLLSPTKILEDEPFNWLIQLNLPGIEFVTSAEVFDPACRNDVPGVLLYASDESHAQVIEMPDKDGSHRVMQGGPRKLWDTVESAYAEWQRINQPGPERFGVVANSTVQFVWLDDDNSWQRWPLPLT